MASLEHVQSLLNTVGAPEILEDPDALASLDETKYDALLEAIDEILELVEERPNDEEVIDALYVTHMTLSSANYWHSVLASGEPTEEPDAHTISKSWGGEALRPYAKDTLGDLIINTSSIATLTQTGLPASAEPGLSFNDTIQRLAEVETIETSDEDEAKDFFNAYWMLGRTEDDDVICLDERVDGAVVVLDRDWGFMSLRYMNASVGHLLATLEAWRRLEHAEEVEPAIERFTEEIEKLDPGALGTGSFWADMLDELEGDEEDEDEDEEGEN